MLAPTIVGTVDWTTRSPPSAERTAKPLSKLVPLPENWTANGHVGTQAVAAATTLVEVVVCVVVLVLTPYQRLVISLLCGA